ncbi:MAG: DUF885 domain-containing protein [Pseudohongiellaceae bacterium]
MRTLLCILLLALAACDSPAPSAPAPELPPAPETPVLTIEPAEQETERLNAWLDEQYEEQLDFSPMSRTRLGNKTDYDRLDDASLAAAEEELQWLRDSVATMQDQFDYELLTEDGKLSWDMWAFTLAQAEAAQPWWGHEYIYGRGGPHSYLPSFMISYHNVDTEEDLQAYISRLREMDRILGQYLQRARQAAEQGVRQPDFGYEFALNEIERVTSGVPFNTSDDTPNSPLWTDFQTKAEGLVNAEIIGDAQLQSYLDEARQVLAGEVLTAYQQVSDWLESDRQFASETAQGVWALPNGEAYYNHRLSRMTTLPLTADEIHNIGLSEVERLRAEMELVKDETGYEGTLEEFFVFVREDEQFYYPNTPEGRQEYLEVNNQYLDAINERLPQFFGRLPKADLEVRRVEAFREQDGAAQHYRGGSPDGSRPGVFYSHMSDMSSLAKWQIEDIAYHEGNPGHHMQISIQQELTDIPRFRTQFFTTAYVEGWGLYAEWLAKEMGGYQDPYSEFGRLAGEIWRAVRLVVDTGIHSRQWSEQQAVDYFLQNSPIPPPAVRSEVQRYFANPGQATAYKIGMMNFQEARARAEDQLGSAFDIRAFHDLVLGAGGLPMPILHARVDRWIAETLAPDA